VARKPGLSARWKLTLSYVGFLVVAGGLLLAVVWVFLLRYVPARGFPAGPPIGPNRGDLIRAFAPAAAWALVFLLAFGLAGGWILAGRMLAPLTRITDAARRAENGSLSHRIELEGRQDEFRELADEFDAMLAQLEAHVDEQRRFAANASHELRTPLATTQALLDAARRDPHLDADELIGRLRAVNTRAIDLTEALLVLSHADQGSFTREEVDLSLLCEEAVETLLSLVEARGIAFEVWGEPALVIGSHALLLQLTTNLVHNAIVHNLPAGGQVWISTARESRSARLRVENTGAVLSRELVATLTEPFQRGEQRIRTDHGGVGLGLAIVKSIVRAHGGLLVLTPRARGGLVAEVVLPVGGKADG
jgi:two-component system sensor histidine kinase VanS